MLHWLVAIIRMFLLSIPIISLFGGWGPAAPHLTRSKALRARWHLLPRRLGREGVEPGRRSPPRTGDGARFPTERAPSLLVTFSGSSGAVLAPDRLNGRPSRA